MNTAITDTSATLMHGQRDDVGKRPNQEDRWEIREFQTADGRLATLAMVADGIGGHNTGEIASQMAKELIPAQLLSQPPSASELTQRLKAALEYTSQAIYDASLTDPNRSGMGTTCTAIVIVDRRLYLAHVGDSRAYLLRGGQLRQLTIDHTWAEEALKAGRPPEEIRTHPNRGVIMRYLGIDPTVSIDTRYRVNDKETADALAGPLHLEPGDTLMLCTDGVSDSVDPRFLAEFMAYPDCQVAADALVAQAIKAGATDNVTAVVLRLPGGVVLPPPSVATMGKKLPLLPILLGALALVAIGAVIALALTGRDRDQAAAMPAPTAVVSADVPATQPPTATPRPVTGGGLSVQTTPLPPPATVAPALPTQSPSGQITETQTLTGTQSATGAPTLIPTFTVQPTRTPVTQATATSTRPATNTSTGSGSASSGMVDLISPTEGEKIIGQAEFEWRPQSALNLKPNERYELIVWGEGEDPLRSGRSPVGGKTETKVTANLSGVEAALGLTPGGTYYWGVRLTTVDGTPVRMLSGGRRFVYERASSGSGGQSNPPCEGEDCIK